MSLNCFSGVFWLLVSLLIVGQTTQKYIPFDLVNVGLFLNLGKVDICLGARAWKEHNTLIH